MRGGFIQGFPLLPGSPPPGDPASGGLGFPQLGAIGSTVLGPPHAGRLTQAHALELSYGPPHPGPSTDPPPPGEVLVISDRVVNNMYRCPICGGTSNRRDRPFETVDSVVGHIDAKRDELHDGERGEDYRREIITSSDVVEVDGEDGEDAPAAAESSASDGNDPDHSGGEGSPGRVPQDDVGRAETEPSTTLMDPSDPHTVDPPEEPVEPEASEELEDDPNCPECGSGYWYPVEEIPAGAGLSEEHREHFDYFCVYCRELFNAGDSGTAEQDPDCPACGHPDWYDIDDFPEEMDLGIDRSEYEFVCVNCHEAYTAKRAASSQPAA